MRVRGIRTTPLRYYDLVSMNNPFSGYHDGSYVGRQLLRLPADEAKVKHYWVETHWLYLGNGVEKMDGSCGCVIVDEDGNAVSFSRFLDDKYPGCGLCVAASTLEKFGYHAA